MSNYVRAFQLGISSKEEKEYRLINQIFSRTIGQPLCLFQIPMLQLLTVKPALSPPLQKDYLYFRSVFFSIYNNSCLISPQRSPFQHGRDPGGYRHLQNRLWLLFVVVFRFFFFFFFAFSHTVYCISLPVVAFQALCKQHPDLSENCK